MCLIVETKEIPKLWNESADINKPSVTTLQLIFQDANKKQAKRFHLKSLHVTVQNANFVKRWPFYSSTEYNLGVEIIPLALNSTVYISLEPTEHPDKDN